MARKEKSIYDQEPETGELEKMETRFTAITKAIEDKTKEAHQQGRFTWNPGEAKEIKQLQDEAETLLKKIHAAKN